MKLHNPLSESLQITCDKAASILEHFIKGTNELDQKLIPTSVLKQASGIAIITMVKAGFFWSGRGGTGLVVSRLGDGSWSAPSAICAAGIGVGAQIGCQITDVIFVLNTKQAVKAFTKPNLTLGGNISVATGPTGRSSEASGSVINPATIYSYSKSKGAFVGITLEGLVILTRKKTNRNMYGRNVTAEELLSGSVPQPTQAEPLYRMLNARFGKFAYPSAITLVDSNSSISTPKEIQAPPKAKPELKRKPMKYKALYDFEGQEKGDLSFKEGDIIWSSSVAGDWMDGTLNGKNGSFPTSYVALA